MCPVPRSLVSVSIIGLYPEMLKNHRISCGKQYIGSATTSQAQEHSWLWANAIYILIRVGDGGDWGRWGATWKKINCHHQRAILWMDGVTFNEPNNTQCEELNERSGPVNSWTRTRSPSPPPPRSMSFIYNNIFILWIPRYFVKGDLILYKLPINTTICRVSKRFFCPFSSRLVTSLCWRLAKESD